MFLLKINILLIVGFDNDCITNSFSMSDFLARKKLQNNQNFRLRNKKCTLKIAHTKKELKYTFIDGIKWYLPCPQL